MDGRVQEREDRSGGPASDSAWAAAYPKQPVAGGEQGSGEDPGRPRLEAGDHAERLH